MHYAAQRHKSGKIDRIWCRSNLRYVATLLIVSFIIVLIGTGRSIAFTNQSDDSGLNVDPIPPVVDPDPITGPTTAPSVDSTIDPNLLQTAQHLTIELKKAYDACLVARSTTINAPRRFVRGVGNLNAPACTSVECTELDRMTQEVKDFLTKLDRTQLQQLRSVKTIRLW